ncbi:leucyl aminopeptidase [bacterium]|nr:leucyl aminopeptidase [bacterium]
MSVKQVSCSKAEGVFVALFPETEKLSRAVQQEKKDIDKAVGFDLFAELDRRSLTRKEGDIHSLTIPGKGAVSTVIIGFGGLESSEDQSCSGVDGYRDSHRKMIRKLAVAAGQAATKFSEGKIFVSQGVFRSGAEEDATLFRETFLLSQYRFERYLSEKKSKGKKPSLAFDSAVKLKLSEVRQSDATASGVSLARDLVNTPAADLLPKDIASCARRIARSSSAISVKVFTKAQLQSKKMNGILSVGRASAASPTFVTLSYRGKPASAAKKRKTVGLVGKGVTFDSGGLSIKPGSGMETMKCDMAGAAAVLGVFESLSQMELPVDVRGYIPAAENMIDGSALRPGDVISMMNGKSVEVLNTDAEGRLILADALHYASHDGCDIVIDLATLTGACVVALGERYAALYGNDDLLKRNLLRAAGVVGEGYWSMPLVAEYREQLKSPVADLKNIGTRWGGSITAALFLENFVGEVSWAHMDIAGPAFLSTAVGENPKGGTGFGVRTLLRFLSRLAEESP